MKAITGFDLSNGIKIAYSDGISRQISIPSASTPAELENKLQSLLDKSVRDVNIFVHVYKLGNPPVIAVLTTMAPKPPDNWWVSIDPRGGK